MTAASDDNGGLPPDDLATQTSNRWTAMSFFENPPTILDPDKGCSIYNGGNWYVQGTGANFEITYPNLNSNQDDIHSVAHYPDSSTSDGDFSVSLSFGIGPFSVGFSKSLFPSVTLTNNSYVDTSWDFDFGYANTDLPTSQDDCVGVRWDYEAESATGYYSPQVTQSYSWEVIHQCSGPGVVTSQTPELLHSTGIDIV